MAGRWQLSAIVYVLGAIWISMILQSNPVANGSMIKVHNLCETMVCAKYWVPSNGVGGGCATLASGQTWAVTVTQSWNAAAMWAITNTDCTSQSPCSNGPPAGVTLFEFTIAGSYNLDYYDLSTLSGFNIPLRLSPNTQNASSCVTVSCQGTTSSSCSNGYYLDGPDATKACPSGTSYDLYLCH